MGKSDSYIDANGVRISKATGKPVKKYRKLNVEYWAAREGEKPTVIASQEVDPIVSELKSLYSDEELKGIIGLKKDTVPIELVEITYKQKKATRRVIRVSLSLPIGMLMK